MNKSGYECSQLKVKLGKPVMAPWLKKTPEPETINDSDSQPKILDVQNMLLKWSCDHQ